jgi:hypothetical protein
VRDPGAGSAGGRQLFDADPRTLLSILDPAARFTDAGTGCINDLPVRHLRATAADDLPAPDLGLQPDTADTSVTRLDLWVGRDDVVGRPALLATRRPSRDRPDHRTARSMTSLLPRQTAANPIR